MTDWSPDQYLKFAGPRLRPALDLLGRIHLGDATRIFDLGCGPGNISGYLAERWSGAEIIGVDQSVQMLEKAKRLHPNMEWHHADLTTWVPDQVADVLYSNACLQWLGDHETLIPKLSGYVRQGGVFAVQMPRVFTSPSHVAMVETAKNGPWAERLVPVLRTNPVAEPDFYYDLLSPLCESLDIWETEYLQILEGENPVAEWVRGTALRPLLDCLGEEERETFFDAYSQRTRALYPKRKNGNTLFPFRRLFIVAVMK